MIATRSTLYATQWHIAKRPNSDDTESWRYRMPDIERWILLWSYSFSCASDTQLAQTGERRRHSSKTAAAEVTLNWLWLQRLSWRCPIYEGLHTTSWACPLYAARYIAAAGNSVKIRARTDACGVLRLWLMWCSKPNSYESFGRFPELVTTQWTAAARNGYGLWPSGRPRNIVYLFRASKR